MKRKLTVLILALALVLALGMLTGCGGNDIESPAEQTGNDTEKNQMPEVTDCLPLFGGGGETYWELWAPGSEARELFLWDRTPIDKSFKLHTDKGIGKIMWYTRNNCWGLEAQKDSAAVGNSGYLHAEKDGKHYAMLVKVVADPEA